GASRGVHQHRLADGDGVAAAEGRFLNEMAVQQGAVAAAEVEQDVAAAGAGPEFEMLAGNLGVVQGNRVRRVTTNGDGRARQIELFALVHSADNNQSGHYRILRATNIP